MHLSACSSWTEKPKQFPPQTPRAKTVTEIPVTETTTAKQTKTKNMDEKSFLNRVRAGEFLAVGEYRHSKAEVINWRDKTNGRPMSATVLRHTVEFGDTSVAVSERVPEGTKPEDIHFSFKKGETVALIVESLSKEKGLVSAQGKLERFAASTGGGAPVGAGQTR